MEVCSFCGRNITQVHKMVQSPANKDIYICDKCSEIIIAILNGEINKQSNDNLRKQWKGFSNMSVMEKNINIDKRHLI